MRDELHLMELVDRYLDGSMNAQERGAFEKRANSSSELRQLIDDQRALREGVARVPVRAVAAKAFRAYRFGKPGPWISGAVVVAIIAASSFFLLREFPSTDTPGTIAAMDTLYERVLDDTAGIHLDPLVINVDPKGDTTLLTPSGIVLDIPSGCFVDSLGRPITSPVRVTVIEALDPLDIMKAGLSTMSGDPGSEAGAMLLETGGMFYFDAQANGKPVRIDPAKPITAMVPTSDARKDMMLYQGVKMPDGRIDWRNPKPLKKSLVPVDITTLDFYPPGYEKKLAELGQDVTDKEFKDSLYWSFIGRYPITVIEGGVETAAADSLLRNWAISPAKIKAIWTARFNNTNLATREFEERMRAIHGTCNNAALDAYVNNLDQDLATVDRKVAAMGYKEFDHFAERNDGRVDLPKHAADRLRRVYENWSRAEAEAIRKTQEKFWREQWKQDVKNDAKRADHAMTENVREGELFQKELQKNIDTVYAQLGLKHRWIPRSAWAVPVVNTGWWNVDIAVIQATTTRTSMSYTDPNSGKSATLTYTPLIVEVADRASYDELVVYLIPNELNSYQRMKEGAGGFTERLNSIFTYDLFCLGMKGKQQFAFKTGADGQQEISASLEAVDENALRQMLRAQGKVEAQLLDEARYFDWLAVDKQRQQAKMKRMELRNALLPVVFPCSNYPTGAPSDNIEPTERRN